MEDSRCVEIDRCVGFGARTLPFHWMGGWGVGIGVLGGLALIFGGGPLLDSHTDPDRDVELVAAIVGAILLVGGIAMFYADRLRQRREIERGRIRALGVFWNLATTEKLEGTFEFDIDVPVPIPGLPAAFRHPCTGMRIEAAPASGTASPRIPRPLLRLVFGAPRGLVKGEFASRTFYKDSDLDAILLLNGSISRLRGRKIDPCALCTEIGNQLKSLPPNAIDVQLVVNLNPNVAPATESSNAGAIGAGVFGIVGGLVGSAIDRNREQEQKRAQAAQQAAHEAEVNKLLQRLDKVAAEFGWKAWIVRNAAA